MINTFMSFQLVLFDKEYEVILKLFTVSTVCGISAAPSIYSLWCTTRWSQKMCAEIKLITSYTIAGILFSSSRLSPDVGKREARYLSSLQSVFALNNTPRMLSIYVSRFIYNASRHGMPQNLKLLLNVPLELTFFQYVLIGIQYLPSSQPLQSITPLQSLVNTVI